MTVSSSTAIFILSLLAIPLTYFVNSASLTYGPLGLCFVGVGSLGGMCFLTYLAVGRKKQPVDSLFYVFILGTFSSVVDLIIALENDGFVHGFMNQYLKDGEPYLKTAYGTVICYWDGMGHYAMYLMMMAAQAWNQSYRHVGLCWAGSIGHSMLVLIPGSVIGKYGVKYSILLNVPYMIIPFACAARFLNERSSTVIRQQQESHFHVSIWRRPMDLLYIFILAFSAILVSLRALAVLGADFAWMQHYVQHYEPYMQDPSAYPRVQMMVYLFYFVPYYCAAICGLIWPGQMWMPDWSLIHAGAAMQAQVSHIGSSLHRRTPYILRVPRDSHIRLVFWSINLFLLIMPQAFAYRCNQSLEFFAPAVPEVKRTARQHSKYE